MPEWLLKNDNYMPSRDRDTFIDKSILSILTVLTRFRLQAAPNKKSAFRIDARVKMISSLILILTVSLTRSVSYIFAVYVLLLLEISLLDARDIKHIIKSGAAAALFTFIIFAPSALMGNGKNTVMIAMKVFASVTIINILSCTTDWQDMMGSLKMFFVPDIFIFAVDITVKYIIVLGELALNMLYALRLRSVGRSRDKHTPLSGIAGTMFIKSKEMSEELYNAMECRGFSGEYRFTWKFQPTIFDYLYGIINILFIAAYFII